MATAAKVNRNASRDLAEIAVPVLEGAHMTRSRRRSNPSTRSARGSTRARRRIAGAYIAYRSAADREDAASRDLQRQSEPT
jgi:VIT1/CCC1 family predicted Fe2+/Mn2+ transporter